MKVIPSISGIMIKILLMRKRAIISPGISVAIRGSAATGYCGRNSIHSGL
jgi:hypothetical protein